MDIEMKIQDLVSLEKILEVPLLEKRSKKPNENLEQELKDVYTDVE